MDRQMSRKVDLLSLLSNFLKYSVMNRDFNQVQILTSLSHPVTSGKLLNLSESQARMRLLQSFKLSNVETRFYVLPLPGVGV